MTCSRLSRDRYIRWVQSLSTRRLDEVLGWASTTLSAYIIHPTTYLGYHMHIWLHSAAESQPGAGGGGGVGKGSGKREWEGGVGRGSVKREWEDLARYLHPCEPHMVLKVLEVPTDLDIDDYISQVGYRPCTAETCISQRLKDGRRWHRVQARAAHQPS